MKTQLNLYLNRGEFNQIRKFSTTKPLNVEPATTTAFLGIVPDTMSGRWALLATMGFFLASTLYRHFPDITLFQEVDEIVLPIPGFDTDMYFRRINGPVWQQYMENHTVFRFESEHIWSPYWYPEFDLNLTISYTIRLRNLLDTTVHSVLQGHMSEPAIRAILRCLYNIDTIHTRLFRALCVYLQKVDDVWGAEFYYEFEQLHLEVAKLGKKLWIVIRTIQNFLGDSPTFRRFFERLWLFDPDREVSQIRNISEVVDHVLDRGFSHHHSILYEYFIFHGLPFYSYVKEEYLDV